MDFFNEVFHRKLFNCVMPVKCLSFLFSYLITFIFLNQLPTALPPSLPLPPGVRPHRGLPGRARVLRPPGVRGRAQSVPLPALQGPHRGAGPHQTALRQR